MATDTLTRPTIVGSTTETKVFKNFIDGEWVESASGETFENISPADTRDVVGIFQKSIKTDVDAAVDAAKRAFAKWRLVPAPRRAEIVYRAAEMLFERKEDYSRDMTREMGKILKETRGDVQEAVDTALLHGWRRTTAVWTDHTFGAAEQVRDGGAEPDWCLRHDCAVELPHGNSLVEAAPSHRVRQYLRD